MFINNKCQMEEEEMAKPKKKIDWIIINKTVAFIQEI